MNKSLATGTNFDFGLIAMWGRIERLACILTIETTKMDPKQNSYMLYEEDFASVCFL
jgi:hypothetical protein